MSVYCQTELGVSMRPRFGLFVRSIISADSHLRCRSNVSRMACRGFGQDYQVSGARDRPYHTYPLSQPDHQLWVPCTV